ncbi:zinc-ribbon domain-containing protein [Yoonia sp.]|uniref:zinc-ribbon domain-containing protein n=1 Tax=Yoonia sp. TaxID=2212373 RepID=UPI00358F6C80
MRLICPNCEAQYEVADDAIPPGGRDVQCSNCQVSWFQTEKPTVPGRDTSQLITPQESEITEDTPPAQEPAEVETPAEEPEAVMAEPDTPEPEPAPQPQRRPLDDAVANILREEASLNAAPAAPAAVAAAAPPSPAPKPPATEVAKPAAPVAADETRQRIALMTAEEGGTRTGTQKPAQPTPTAPSESADEAHLRTVPSINEINATLRARAQANDTSGLTEIEKEEAVQRKGFRRGFFWVLILLAILILPYVFADQITENLPQTTDMMTSYVIMVDQLRLSLNEMITGLTAE